MALLSNLADLDGRRIAVEVPATSANLGAGYDTLAVALEIVDRIEVEAIARPGAGVELNVDGEGAGELPADRSNGFVIALERGLAEARGDRARRPELAHRDGEPDPAQPRARLVRGSDRRRGSLPAPRSAG